MAISYPLTTPTSIGIASIEFRAVNAVSTSKSPFTFKQQTFQYPGQVWEANITIPPVHRELSYEWESFLLALNGQVGTFLLSPPNSETPLGTATDATVTGGITEDTPEFDVTGTFKAGDWFQVGTGTAAKLHRFLEDKADGTSNVSIWPSLRATYSAETVYYENPKGVFRLKENSVSWYGDSTNQYGVSFSCIEAIS